TTRELKRAQNVITEHAGRGFGKKIRRHERVDVRIIRSPDAQGWALRFVLDGKFLDNYGWEAQHLAHLVAPAINFQGAASRHVDAAVREIERSGSPQLYFMELVKYRERNDLKYTGLYGYPHEMRIAFEMASHEETERAAIEGDLTQLEADWRYAEEIASIADNLLLPRAVTDLMERFKAAKKA
ncbi:MAG TPA: hypothetical protein VF042_10015, partial [Gemmatimonadaceae bacterium]